MKVFVGFRYDQRDEWIKELVVPFIEVLGCEVITGEEVYGSPLPTGVFSKVKDCDACIGFLTRREGPDANGKFTTHPWVIQELSNANGNGKPIMPIVENGVNMDLGMINFFQYSTFDYAEKAPVLLEIAKFIMMEKPKITFKTFMLWPEEFVNNIRPHINLARCSYRFLHKNKEYDPEMTTLKKMPSGFGVFIRKIPGEDAAVDIKVESQAGTWSSGYVSVGSINVNLSKDN